MGCEAKLAWKCLQSGPLLSARDLTRKVGLGQTGLIFCEQWAFISRSVRAGLQVSVCNGYDLCHHGWPKIEFLHFDPCDLEQ